MLQYTGMYILRMYNTNIATYQVLNMYVQKNYQAYNQGFSSKPEPIMLLILPIIISSNFHPLFFIYSHAIIYYSYYSSNLIVSLVKSAAKVL